MSEEERRSGDYWSSVFKHFAENNSANLAKVEAKPSVRAVAKYYYREEAEAYAYEIGFQTHDELATYLRENVAGHQKENVELDAEKFVIPKPKETQAEISKMLSEADCSPLMVLDPHGQRVI